MTSLKVFVGFLLLSTLDLVTSHGSAVNFDPIPMPAEERYERMECSFDAGPENLIIKEMSISAIKETSEEFLASYNPETGELSKSRADLEVSGEMFGKKGMMKVKVEEDNRVMRYVCRVKAQKSDGMVEDRYRYNEIRGNRLYLTIKDMFRKYWKRSDQRLNLTIEKILAPPPKSSCEYFRTNKANSPREIVITKAGDSLLCDTQTDGGGWIVFQKRSGWRVNFTRTWADYQSGFGTFDSSFWLGLERISNLTSHGKWEMRVDFKVFDSLNEYYASYSEFKVGDKSTRYQLHLAGFKGNTTDALTQHNANQFSAYDDDASFAACTLGTGGWWFVRFSCGPSNLNGIWREKISTGSKWGELTDQTTLMTSEMKMRLVE